MCISRNNTTYFSVVQTCTLKFAYPAAVCARLLQYSTDPSGQIDRRRYSCSPNRHPFIHIDLIGNISGDEITRKLHMSQALILT